MSEPDYQLPTPTKDRLWRYSLAAWLAVLVLWFAISYSPWACLLVTSTLVVAIVPIGRRARALVRLPDVQLRNDEAMNLLAEGRAKEAYERWLPLLEQTRRLGKWRALMVHNLGIARLQSGDVEGALPMLRAFHEAGWHRVIGLPAQRVTFRASYAVALLANGLLDEAERLIRAEGNGNAWIGPRIQLAARRRRYDEALELVRTQWAAAEGATRTNMRGLRVIAAFCIVNATVHTTPYRSTEALPPEAQTFLAGVHPFVRGSLDWLWAKDWPELAAFAAQHDLGA